MLRPFRKFLVSFGILFIVWLVLNNSLNTQHMVVGVVVSMFLAFVFAPKAEIFSDMKLTPKSLFYLFIYFFVFSYALLKSAIDVALRVISPEVRIKPGVVKVKTNLKTPMGRLMLANSITLTPGTLTVDIKDDFLFIHWIDVTSRNVEGATREIAAGFEKYLEVIYG